jgi:hypothetical protein
MKIQKISQFSRTKGTHPMTIKNPHINRTRDYDPATGKKLERGASPASASSPKRTRGDSPASASSLKRTRGDSPASASSLKRTRGGQRGNINARRHGFYSKSFTPSEMQALDSNVKGEFHDEINAARVHASHLAELMKDYKNMPLQDFISASNALNNYLDRIQSLTRAQKFIYNNQTTIEKAIEELANIPPEED